MSQNNNPNQTGERPVRLRRRLPFIAVVAAALVGGAIGGTGGFALAMGDHQGWHGPRLERIQAMVGRALDGVGATSAQEARIHDVIASTFTSMTGDRAEQDATRKQMLDLLRAPTLDRDAIEKLRAAEVARFDAKSKTLVGAVLEAADQLSPAQRTALADRAEQMMARHRHMDGGPQGHHDGDDKGQRDPDRDGAPDKG